MSVRDLIIVGGGPSGLAAAINAKKRGIDSQVIEQGGRVNSIYRFPPQMVFFTTPELLEIGGLPFPSPYEKPTRAEALNYYRKVVDTYDLQIAFEEKVVAIRRDDARDEREREPSAAAERERAKRHALGVGPLRETELWGPASSEEEEIPADAVYLLTGYRADTELMCRAGVMLTERQGPVHNPETFETNVPGLFVAGGAIAGVETGTIFIENGRFHGEKIIEEIARRL